ncbi:SsgA family sporulation/cell division regulator [Kitasatospora sp. NPDC101801]|uniref:SsgA family sporulation/cell division regulator n=1 Tax=Kitasatospora sp. NPDC101801 TaxID=3364103 RepID=UPI00382584C7
MPFESVVHPITGVLIGPLAPVRFTARIEYQRSDPFAVRMLFGPELTFDSTPVAWTFARQLLSDGLSRRAGHGDVRVSPYGAARTTIELRDHNGCALLVLHTQELEAFLNEAETLVATGSEEQLISWDAELAALVRDAV